jgi:hypothetical protein
METEKLKNKLKCFTIAIEKIWWYCARILSWKKEITVLKQIAETPPPTLAQVVADIVIAVDDSAYLRAVDFTNVQGFLRMFFTHLNLNPQGSSVALISYNNDTKAGWNLQMGNNQTVRKNIFNYHHFSILWLDMREKLKMGTVPDAGTDFISELINLVTSPLVLVVVLISKFWHNPIQTWARFFHWEGGGSDPRLGGGGIYPPKSQKFRLRRAKKKGRQFLRKVFYYVEKIAIPPPRPCLILS